MQDRVKNSGKALKVDIKCTGQIGNILKRIRFNILKLCKVL